MKKNESLYILLLFKKIRNMKIRSKIRFFLFFMVISITLGIGSYSYSIAKKELVHSSKDTVMSIEKQGGKTLDDRINDFRDVSYRIIQSSQITKLLDYSAEEALRLKTMNEGLPSVIAQQTSIRQYTKYALLMPSSGVVYDYYKSGERKHNSVSQKDLLNQLDQYVDRGNPVCWINYGDEVFFVRQIITPDFQEKGIICFAMDPSFFDIVSDDIKYLNNDNIIILNETGEILKCKDNEKGDEILTDIETFSDTDYYVYNFTKELDGEVHTVTIINTPRNNWRIISYFSHRVLLRGIASIYSAITSVIIFALAFALLVTGIISGTITKNINLIEKGMKEYEEGHFDYRISPSNYDEVGLLGLQLNYMAVKISDLVHMLHLEEEEKKKQEIEILQAQINPHFLYNTLGSLKWAAFQQGQMELADTLDALIKLLRFTIKKAGGLVTVADEINYIKNYTAIEKMRYGEHFTITYDIAAETEHMMIPGFILQPLVENCFLHGLDMSKDDGVILITSYQETDFLCLEVADNGLGMNPEKVAGLLVTAAENKKYKGFSSIGLQIVDKRLREIYGEKYETRIKSKSDEGTVITLRIPLERDNYEYN